MANRYEEQAEEWLEGVFARRACAWCRNRNKALYRLAMCRSCYGIRVELKQLHKDVRRTSRHRGDPRPLANAPFVVEFRYKVAIAMAESAQILGRAYERLLTSAGTLDCEWEFRSLSKRFIKKELFAGGAFLFENFSPVHRRYLMYLVGQIMQEFYSRNRRRMAYGNVASKTVKEVLAERSWGTYRVENDTKPPSDGRR